MSLRVGRYDPCPCGSGKKLKFCCGSANSKAPASAGGRRPNPLESPPKRKMSEMILEMGEGFLGGDTMGERQNRLTAACSAWNMACRTPEIQAHQLEEYGQTYLQFNPATSPTDLANILKDMRVLMDRKMKMFPDDKRQIVSARVVKVGENYRTEVVSGML